MNNNSILLIVVVLMAVALEVVSMRDGKKGRGAHGPSQRERPQTLAPDAPLGFFGLFNRKKKVEAKKITLKKDPFSTGKTLKKTSSATKSVSDAFSTSQKVTSNATTAEKNVARNIATIGNIVVKLASVST